MIGPTAEAALAGLRGDKMFLAVNQVIGDNALPAGTRRELSKPGIQVITAKTE